MSTGNATLTIYRDLRESLGISATEPMLPLPPEELSAWCRRYAALLAEGLQKHAATRAMAVPAVLEPMLLLYGRPADDPFLESQLATGPMLLGAGISALLIHAVFNAAGLSAGRQAAREVLSPEGATLLEERFPTAMLFRHALMQEGLLGALASRPRTS